MVRTRRREGQWKRIAAEHTRSMSQGARREAPPRGSIAVRGLVKTYQREGVAVPALRVDLDIAAGDQVALMGPSGSGKSTLLHCLATSCGPPRGASRSPASSRLLSEGANSDRRLRSYGVFQDGQLLPELPCEENVALPYAPRTPSRRGDRAGPDPPRAPRLRRPRRLPPGAALRRRTGPARRHRPSARDLSEIVFADEPTGALDQGPVRR